MIDILAAISDVMGELGVTYAFERFEGDPEYPYFVGEYTETEVFTEDGLRECTVTITGTTKGEWIELEGVREKIEHAFNPVSGYRPGEGIVIYYAWAMPVPTDEADLKRIQISLNCKKWRVI